MKASDYIMSYLAQRGVTHVFEVIGGMITHLVDSAYCHEGIQLVSMHHEQAAAFAADAMGRITGIPGVAMATSGPGATNLLTGIGSCYFDSVPAIFLTGQVNLIEQKGDRNIRQLGFQETDIVSIAGPITKAAWSVRTVEEIPSLLEKAFELSTSGRPGPVLIDIPMDIQRMDLSPDSLGHEASNTPRAFQDTAVFEELLSDIKGAERPLILVGGGVRAARAIPFMRALIEKLQIPVVNSLMGVDVLPYRHPLHAGLIGSYGNRWANTALGSCDLLLVLGSRLDIRQTGADVQAFQSGRKIYHIDCEDGEINNRVKATRGVLADLNAFLSAAVQAMPALQPEAHQAWLDTIRQMREEWPDTRETGQATGINPNQLMHEISAASRRAGAYVVDVGNHQMWAAQSVEVEAEQHFITSGGMGSMGYSLPAAIGTSIALGKRPIVQIVGDGGMQMNIQELQTIKEHNLPIKMVLLNNRSYGMVRQFQQSYFHDRYPSTYWGYSAPDFSKVAAAYGIASATIVETGEMAGGLEALWKEPSEPFLLQVMIDTMVNAYPKIAFGHPITEMEPFVKPLDMEGT